MKTRAFCHWLTGLCLLLLSGALFADKKDDLVQLRGRIAELQRDLQKSEESRSEAADALRVSEKAISEVNRNLTTLGREQTRITQSLNDLGRRIKEAKAETGQHQALLERMIRYQYMHGTTDSLRLMLEGRDIASAERQLQYLGYVGSARSASINALKLSTAKLSDLETVTKQQQEELAANAAAQKEARRTLQQERAQRQKMFSKIKLDIDKGRKEIGRLKRDEERLAKLVAQLARAIEKSRSDERAKRRAEAEKKGEPVDQAADAANAGAAFENLKGKLKLPARGELRGRFGSPREEGGVTWKGVFIKAESGSPVKAVADGQVVYADWFRGYGNLLVIDHGGGYLSLYGNNESLLKEVGDLTTSGETVASVGASGGALESGVYFELRFQSNAFDPLKWVGR